MLPPTYIVNGKPQMSQTLCLLTHDVPVARIRMIWSGSTAFFRPVRRGALQIGHEATEIRWKRSQNDHGLSKINTDAKPTSRTFAVYLTTPCEKSCRTDSTWLVQSANALTTSKELSDVARQCKAIFQYALFSPESTISDDLRSQIL